MASHYCLAHLPTVQTTGRSDWHVGQLQWDSSLGKHAGRGMVAPSPFITTSRAFTLPAWAAGGVKYYSKAPLRHHALRTVGETKRSLRSGGRGLSTSGGWTALRPSSSLFLMVLQQPRGYTSETSSDRELINQGCRLLRCEIHHQTPTEGHASQHLVGCSQPG